MANKKIIKEQRIKDVKELMIQSTDNDWWEHVQDTNTVCSNNNSPDALYVAIYRTKPYSAITHIARVSYTENNIPARETYKDYPAIIRKATKRGFIDKAHKVYHLEKLIELPEPINKGKKVRGVVMTKWFKNITYLLITQRCLI